MPLSTHVFFLSPLQKPHRFHISGSREHVHAACLHKLIPTAFKYLHVTRKACRLAGYINYRIDAEINNRADCFRMDSITRRIEYDYIGLVREISDNLKDITRYEFTVVKTVKMSFSRAATTASSTISTPTTLEATGAITCAIVPVPL